ncbi:hypothetical protein D6777_01440 [Candidatus Woesearchaeota archaeon]|nr:MAG: hypothetical protein D6777_01440 [Candidatus Woesearchaeota archaeon]
MQVYKISEKFMQEINFISKTVSEIVGQDVECYGLILSDGGNHGRRYYLPKQEVYNAKAIAFDLNESFRDVYENNRRVIGVWHSHGSLPVFHSSYDDKHVEESVKHIKKIFDEEYKDEWHYENGVVTGWRGCYEVGRKFKDCIEDKVLSVVINNHEEYYAQADGERLMLEYINDKRCFDKEKIVKEIGNNVVYNGKMLKDYDKFKHVLARYDKKANLLRSRLGGVAKLERIITGKYVYNGKRQVKWEDRMKHFNEMYKVLWNEENMHKRINVMLDKLETSYVKRKHPEKYEEVKRKLKTLKYRSMHKVIRRKWLKRQQKKKAQRSR